MSILINPFIIAAAGGGGGGGGGTPAFVNYTLGGSGALATSAVSDAFVATAGNCIVAMVSWSGVGDNRTPSITDTAGNTYTQLDRIYNANSGQVTVTFYAKNILGNASNVLTFSLDDVGGYLRVVAGQYSGLSTTAPVDQHNASTDGDVYEGTISSPSFTTTAANEVIVAMYSANVGASGWNDSFTSRVYDGSVEKGLADLIVSSIQTGYVVTLSSGLGYHNLMVVTLK
jgi:hypothetical protein